MGKPTKRRHAFNVSDAPAGDPPAPVAPPVARPGSWPVLSGHALVGWTPPEGTDLWGPAILRRGVLSVLCGESRTGKSTMAIGLVATSWRGEGTFCGWTLRPRIRALFVGSEGSRMRWKDDLAACADTMPPDARDGFLDAVAVVDEWGEPPAGQAMIPSLVDGHAACNEAVAGLAGAIASHRADLVVVDPLYSVAMTETEDRLLIAALDGLRRACRAASPGNDAADPAVLVLAHLPPDGMDVEDMRRVLSPHGHPAPMRGNRVLGLRARSVVVVLRHDATHPVDKSVVVAVGKASEAKEGSFLPGRWEMRREPWNVDDVRRTAWRWHRHPGWDEKLWLESMESKGTSRRNGRGRGRE